MAKDEKYWAPEFLRYMDFIVNHKNYKGLPITVRPDGSYAWIATAKSDVGRRRIEWVTKKADELGIQKATGFYAEVMRQVHPIGLKPCQICGVSMSIYYHYPNANFLKTIARCFNIQFSQTDHIESIWDTLVSKTSERIVREFFIDRFDLPHLMLQKSKKQIIDCCERACRLDGKGLLGPGAMSNFPDRFDGFHTYNRCCRSEQDKGRHSENMKGYTKDRRAYEYWSDGNIHAANMFMGSQYFDGASADHIGPISLGFVHDSHYLQRMDVDDNSTKRDRLLVSDIEEILRVQRRSGVYPMSWYSSKIWEYIVSRYKQYPELVPTKYRDMLKQNMVNFMFILNMIINTCGERGVECLSACFLDQKSEYFDYAYEFDNAGNVVKTKPRHFTERNSGEMLRFKRIAIKAVIDFNEKDNRNMAPSLTKSELFEIERICHEIECGANYERIKHHIISLMIIVQNRTIDEMA